MLVDAQLLPAKADHLDVEVIVDELDLFAQLHKLIMLAQQPPQDFGELKNQLPRQIGIKTHQRRDGVQRVEKKMRIDLALQGVEPGLEQQFFLLFQLHLDARVVPNFNWNGDGSHHRGKNRQQRHGGSKVNGKQPVRSDVVQLHAGGLQGHNGEKESGLPVDARMAQIASQPTVDAHVHERREGKYLFSIAAENAKRAG